MTPIRCALATMVGAAAISAGACSTFSGADDAKSSGDSGAEAGMQDAASDATPNADAEPAGYHELSDQERWTAYDFTQTDPNVTDVSSATFDGRYVYFIPSALVSSEARIVRFDTTASFASASSWKVVRLADVLTFTGRFAPGAPFDGRFLYLISTDSHLFVRLDTTADITKPGSWTTFDIATALTSATAPFLGVYDGVNILFGATSGNGVVARHIVKQPLGGDWAAFDLGTLSSKAKNTRGLVFDGRSAYFLCGAVVARLDTQGTFASASGWKTFDVDTLDAGVVTAGRLGGPFDGRHVYFVALTSGFERVVRYDTKADFALTSSWMSVQASIIPGHALGNGLQGEAFDGRFVYFAGNELARYDTQRPLDDSTSWTSRAPSEIDKRIGQVSGPAFDGRYLYFFGTPGGVVMRFDARAPRELPPSPSASYL